MKYPQTRRSQIADETSIACATPMLEASTCVTIGAEIATIRAMPALVLKPPARTSVGNSSLT